MSTNNFYPEVLSIADKDNKHGEFRLSQEILSHVEGLAHTPAGCFQALALLEKECSE